MQLYKNVGTTKKKIKFMENVLTVGKKTLCNDFYNEYENEKMNEKNAEFDFLINDCLVNF